MLASSLLSLATPAVMAAPANDDLALTAGVLPLEGVHYDLNEAMFPKVQVENIQFFTSSNRQINAEICEGDYTSTASCPSSGTTTGSTTISGMQGKTTITAEFTSLFFMAFNAGIHTIIFEFPTNDLDTSNDVLTFIFWIDSPLRDIIVHDSDFDSEQIYNIGSPIPTNIDLQARSWDASENITVGWEMFDENPIVATASDCIEWTQVWFENQTDEWGNMLMVETITYLEGTQESFYDPWNASISVYNDSASPGEIMVDVLVTGAPFLVDHSLSWSVMTEGVETMNGTIEFTGDFSGLFSDTYSLNWANGTTCFSLDLIVPEVIIGSDSAELSGISGSFTSQTHAIPDIVAPFEGEYMVRAGVFGAASDPNPHNDLVEFPITIDDTVDVWIREVLPARGTLSYVEYLGQFLTLYPYGNNSIKVIAGNIGYKPVTGELTVWLYDYVSLNLAAGPFSCTVTIEPGEEEDCVFTVTMIGPYIINASFNAELNAIDVNPGDNWFEDSISINMSDISPQIQNPLANSIYLSGQDILLVAGHGPMAPLPLNFTWKLNYYSVLGYGQVVTTSLPMGEWLITLYVEDEFGNREIAATPVRVLNRVEFSHQPYVESGTAISVQAMHSEFDGPMLPQSGRMYPMARNKGKAPLMMFNLSMEPSSGQELTIDSMDSWVSLGNILPPEINRSTVELLHVLNFDETPMEEIIGIDNWEIHPANDSMKISLKTFRGGTFMLIGELDPIVVNPKDLNVVLLKDGQVSLTWENEGDIDNPYFGGWRIYRKVILRFAFPFDSEGQFNAVVTGFEVVDLPTTATGWDDPTDFVQGDCVSYLVMSTDRQGLVNWEYGNVTGGVWNPVLQRMDVPEICVDDADPDAQVDSLSVNLTFNNASKSHTIRLAWQWPEVGDSEQLTWNLYRSQANVQSVRYLTPVLTGMTGEAGEWAWLNETEGGLYEDIHIGQFYFYVLVPFDEVGNSDYLVRAGNARSITVEDMYWDYHLAPPAPPPPPPPDLPIIGPSEWYGRLQDDFNTPRFQQAGMVFMGVFVMNLLLIPMVINRFKLKKKQVRRAKARASKRADMMGDDEEFDDEFDEFFS
jgi:hypothetical protein